MKSEPELQQPEAIDTTDFKVTKLPPAYPEGSDAGMRRWTVRANTNNQHGNVRNYHEHDEWEIGGARHLALLDLGASLDPDTWGNPLLDWRPTLPVPEQPPNGRPAYHQHGHGIVGEANGIPTRIGSDQTSSKAYRERKRAKQELRRSREADNGS